MRKLLLGAILVTATFSVHGESADYTFVPPTSKAALQPAGPVSASALSTMLDEDYPRYSIETYAGQTKALKQASTGPALQVAVGAALDWSGLSIFDQPSKKGSVYHWRTNIQSVDATALRLKVDLNQLHPDDTVWVIDTLADHAFGPYTLADTETNGRWLATTMGDNAVLWVCTTSASRPNVTVKALSHHYESMVPKQTNPCPIPADCITNTALTEVSTGIGRLTITDEQGIGGLCSGALINNENTATLEAYFLTADHCFNGSAATIFASGLEVVWDFRASGCDGVEPSQGNVASYPRSTGSAFLGNSTTLDGVLLELASVPVGTRGRAYLGWDTRTPIVSEDVVCLHHPAGTAMKESIGTVKTLDVDTTFGQNQTTLTWSEGLTEGGSSGSPSVYNDGNFFRIFGMLSNGNFQSCSDASERVDQYSSFREFFSQVGGFLVDATPPSAGSSSYAQNNTGGEETLTGCLQDTAKSRTNAGDLLVAGLALMCMAAWSSFRTRP
jgi:hypothetical protein